MPEKSIGIVGLGKMGSKIAFRLLGKNYKVVAYNRSERPLNEAAAQGAVPARSLKELAGKLGKKRIVWLMLPAGEPTEMAIDELSRWLGEGDTVIDGSNSRYTDSIRHHAALKKKGVMCLDAGCSGGPGAVLNGMCIMVGGDRKAFDRCESLFKDLSLKNGYGYMGSAGAGHFVKMVHNAVEYGMMQAIAEGSDLLANGPYSSLDLAEICKLWGNGSIIEGKLIRWAGQALEKDPKLASIKPYVEDSGEGRWAVETAIELGVPLTAISHSMYERFSSRREYQFSRRLLAAIRHEFGGHEVKKE